MAGLTETGFEAKTLEEILSEIQSEQRSTIDTTLDQSNESLLGSLNASMATKLRELWELAAIVYDARNPRNASFSALDDLCAFTGTSRNDAQRGLVTLSVRLSGGATLPQGSVAHVVGQAANRWRTKAAATNSGGSPAWIDVAGEAESTGRFVANANTITVIATPVTGWLAVNNPLDAAEGTEVETDSALRTRREIELARPGTATEPAIQADLADVAVDGVKVVQSVFVESNRSAYYDEYRRPPHTVEAVVQFTPGLSGDGLTAARQALAEQLWRSVAGGIDTYGNQSATVTDSNGRTQTMRWTEPTQVEIYVDLSLTIDASSYAGNDAVLAAVLGFGDRMKLGEDVIRAKLICALIEVPGIRDVVVKLGKSATTRREQNITIGPRELAVFDSSRIS